MGGGWREVRIEEQSLNRIYMNGWIINFESRSIMRIFASFVSFVILSCFSYSDRVDKSY